MLAIIEAGLSSRIKEDGEEIDTIEFRVAEKNGRGKQYPITMDLDHPLGELIFDNLNREGLGET